MCTVMVVQRSHNRLPEWSPFHLRSQCNPGTHSGAQSGGSDSDHRNGAVCFPTPGKTGQLACLKCAPALELGCQISQEPMPDHLGEITLVCSCDKKLRHLLSQVTCACKCYSF